MSGAALVSPDAAFPIGAAAATRSIRRWTLGGVLIVASVLAGGILWSALAPIASAVVAPGLVKVDTSRKKIQHQEGGVIKEILVHDGSRVNAGDVLIRLDETRASAQYGVLQSQADAAMALQARLVAERDGADAIVWPQSLVARARDPQVAEILEAQQSQFRARRAALVGQFEIIDKQIVAKTNEIEGLAGQQAAKDAQIASLQAELDGLSALLNKAMVEKTKLRTFEREIARLQGERAEHISDIASARALIGEKELQKFQIRKALEEEVTEQLRKTQSELYDYQERMQAASYVLAQTELKAPVDGIVTDLRAHTEGGVVTPGEVVLEIVPANDRLIVEAKVRPQDVDRVRVGLDAGIKLSAFDQRSLPELDGKVTYLSADALEDPRTGQAYFVVRIEVPEAQIARLEGQAIQPGMMADVFVRTGERTFFEYLMHPIMASMHKAWKER
jgi:HlyD family type I secretion membrane fusion protein